MTKTKSEHLRYFFQLLWGSPDWRLRRIAAPMSRMPRLNKQRRFSPRFITGPGK